MKTPKAIRWTINNAALEFQVGTKTVSSRLKSASMRPGSDGKYSTVQIAEALFDSEHVQRVRLTKEQADAKEMENAESVGKLVPVIDLANRMRPALEAMAKLAKDCPAFEPEERVDFMKSIQQLYGSIFGERITYPSLLDYIKKNKLNLPINEKSRVSNRV
jgi:hypothetical protein